MKRGTMWGGASAHSFAKCASEWGTRQSFPSGESYLPRIMHGVSHDLFAVGSDFDRKFDGLRVAFL